MADPHIPAANKTDIITPGLGPDEAGTIDNHLGQMDATGYLFPPNFVVTDIEPAPANFAGATESTTGGYRHVTNSRPIVLVNQGGRWLITHDSAIAVLNALWISSQRELGGNHWVPC